MKALISFSLALSGGIALLTQASWAQPADDTPQPSHSVAVFRTVVPKHRAPGRPALPSEATASPSSAAAALPATFSGTTHTVGPTVSPTTTAPEAEEHIAVDPNNPNTLVAGISDFSSTREIFGESGYNTTKFAVSTDNGNSWQQGFVPTTAPVDQGGYPVTGDGFTWDANSDPVVAIDRAGRVYMANLYFNDLRNNDNGFYVNVDNNLNDGLQFTAAQTYSVAKNINAAHYTFEDKPWIAVDNSTSAHAGTVYVSWTHYFTVVTTSGNPKHPTTRYTTTDAIVFSRSTDHGVTWLTTPIQVSPTSQNGNVQGSQVAVGPDGTVYVVWEGASQQFLAKSSNGGLTFSPAGAISPVFTDLNFSSSYRINSFPALAVNPVNGAVYVAYADQPSASSRIEFIASFDHGATFTAPVALDDDNSTGQRLMPGLAVDESGKIHCSWFDTRNSSDGTAEHFDIYATYSADNGTTFASNARVTTLTFSSPGTFGFVGDYSGIAAAGGYAHPVWNNAYCSDTACGGTLQTASLLVPSADAFVLSAAPAFVSVAPGLDATYQVTVQASPAFVGNNDSVSFSVSGLPADGAFSFSPPSLTGSGSSTLTLSSSTVGSYPLTIVATSSGAAPPQSVPVLLVVQNPDFALSVSPTSATVPWLLVANGTGTPSWTVGSEVSLSRVGNYADGVSLSLSGFPAGSGYSFAPNPATGNSSLLTFTAANMPGTYALTVTGTGNGVLSGVTRNASSTLVVLSAPTTVSVVTPSGTIGYGTSGGSGGTKDLTVAVKLLNNFGQPVAGATVGNTLTLTSSTGTSTSSGTANTGSNGIVTFILRNAPTGNYTLKVTRVTATGLTWDGLTPANSYTKTK